MAKKKTSAKTTKKKTVSKIKKPNFTLSNQQKLVFGSLLLIIGILLFIAFLSYLFTGTADQSIISKFASREAQAENWLNKVGAWVSDLFIYKGFGIASFIFSGLIFISGIYVVLNIKKARLARHWFWGTLIVIWLSILFGFAAEKSPLLGGVIGYEMNDLFQDYIGKIGTALLLLLCLIIYLAIRFKLTSDHIIGFFKKARTEIKGEFEKKRATGEEDESYVPFDNSLSEEAETIKSFLFSGLE